MEVGVGVKVIDEPRFEWIRHNVQDNRASIAESARNCYQSEAKGFDSDSKLISMLVERGHLSPIEMGDMKVRFICDRGVSHELVRHRIASYAQESTRYCNYSKEKFGKEITVVKPVTIKPDTCEYDIWYSACLTAEQRYFELLDLGVKPEIARSVLPTSLKTSIDIKANLREWLNIFQLRDSRHAHPDIRWMIHGLLLKVADDYPEIFMDLMLERNLELIEDFVEKKGN